jgi:hypothetical protein
VLTLAALKLTCKYWGCEIFWNGLMIVAGVDVLVRSVIGIAGLLLLGRDSLFYATRRWPRASWCWCCAR